MFSIQCSSDDLEITGFAQGLARRRQMTNVTIWSATAQESSEASRSAAALRWAASSDRFDTEMRDESAPLHFSISPCGAGIDLSDNPRPYVRRITNGDHPCLPHRAGVFRRQHEVISADIFDTIALWRDTTEPGDAKR